MEYEIRENPEEGEGEGGEEKVAIKRGSWKGNLRYDNRTVSVRIFKLEKSALLARQRVYFKDNKGILCTKTRVDAVTKKYVRQTDIWVNELGEEVPYTELKSYTKVGETEERVMPFEKTDIISLDIELTPSESSEMLAAEVYDVVPDKEEDIPVLYEIAKTLAEKGVEAAGTITFRKSFVKVGIVFAPKIDPEKKEFAVICKTVADRITPRSFFPIPSGKRIETTKAKTLEIDPFASFKKKE